LSPVLSDRIDVHLAWGYSTSFQLAVTNQPHPVF
jgi:hypothetical protein